MTSAARVLVCEPSPALRELVVEVVTSLGHMALVPAPSRPAPAVDVVVVEPADPASLEAARAARRANGPAGVVCVSIDPHAPAAADLEPVAHVMKPFAIRELEAALAAALAFRESRS